MAEKVGLRRGIGENLDGVSDSVRGLASNVTEVKSRILRAIGNLTDNAVAGRILKTITNSTDYLTNIALYGGTYTVNFMTRLTDALRHTPFLRDEASRADAWKSWKATGGAIVDPFADGARALIKGVLHNETMDDQSNNGREGTHNVYNWERGHQGRMRRLDKKIEQNEIDMVKLKNRSSKLAA